MASYSSAPETPISIQSLEHIKLPPSPLAGSYPAQDMTQTFLVLPSVQYIQCLSKDSLPSVWYVSLWA